jgi:hypothetical protein
VIAGPPECIVERNVDQGGQKGVAHFARCAGEPGDGTVGGRAGGELAVADGQGHEHLKPLIVLGQVAHHIRQQFEGVDVLVQERGRGWRQAGGRGAWSRGRGGTQGRGRVQGSPWPSGLQPMACAQDTAPRHPDGFWRFDHGRSGQRSDGNRGFMASCQGPFALRVRCALVAVYVVLER